MKKEQLALRFFIFLQDIGNLNNPCNKQGKLGKAQYFLFQKKSLIFGLRKELLFYKGKEKGST